MLHVDFLSKLEINNIICKISIQRQLLCVCLACRRSDVRIPCSRDGPNSYNRVVTVPLLKALQ